MLRSAGNCKAVLGRTDTESSSRLHAIALHPPGRTEARTRGSRQGVRPVHSLPSLSATGSPAPAGPPEGLLGRDPPREQPHATPAMSVHQLSSQDYFVVSSQTAFLAASFHVDHCTCANSSTSRRSLDFQITASWGSTVARCVSAAQPCWRHLSATHNAIPVPVATPPSFALHIVFAIGALQTASWYQVQVARICTSESNKMGSQLKAGRGQLSAESTGSTAW